MDDLKPCPFCGSKECLAFGENLGKGHYIYCYECIVEGPFDEDRAVAIKKWNTRLQGEEKC